MVGELNRQQTSYVDKIIDKVDDMSRLVNNLLDLGRIEAGVGLQLEMVPVHDILEKVVSGLRLQAAQKHINLEYSIPDKSVQLIEADQALLEQALHNLVENSIKFTDANGSVKVTLNKHGERIIFEVRDNGIGIAPADQQRLFEKFYRAARRGPLRDHGTGLGLTIVKSIAERHGGRVWLESNLGKGSIFYLEIPVQQETQVEKNVVKLEG
jgi:two-component system phosphate regulon sensor histidine kinase PhoR